MLGTQASMLVISLVDHHLSGIHTCRAENAAGMSTHSAELTVNGIFTGRTEILYLQRSLRLFLLTLVESLWIKESLWWLCTILEEETGPMLSPGISRGTSSTQTLIWSDHHHAGHTIQSAHYKQCWLQTQWHLHLQSWELCRCLIIFSLTWSQW